MTDTKAPRLRELAEAAMAENADLYAVKAAGFIGLHRWHFYAAANPAAILTLLDELDALRAELARAQASYAQAIEMLDDLYDGSLASYDIREDLIVAYAASGQDIPLKKIEGLPQNETEYAALQSPSKGGQYHG